MRRILRTMCLSEGPLNRYQIESKLKVRTEKPRRETLYEVMERAKLMGLIEVTSRMEWRTVKRRTLMSESYALTETGLHAVAIQNPDLLEAIRSKLGRDFETLEERAKRNRLAHLEEWTGIARNVLLSGKAPPHWSMGMELFTDTAGRVAYRQWIGPQRDKVKAGKPAEDNKTASGSVMKQTLQRASPN